MKCISALLALLPALVLSLAPAAAMAAPKAVLELFTSEGCSSCPPADKLFAAYAARDDIVALAYHVDYWDYIGWPDTFGSAANSDYQRAYARAQGEGRVYTPQLMINGVEDVVGSRKAEAQAALERTRLPLPVALEAGGDMLEIAIGPKAGLEEAAVWLVTFKGRADVKIARGENSGRTISYVQIVTGRQVLGMWDPKTGTHIKLPLDQVLGEGSDGAAIIVQEQKDGGLPGAILGAAAYEPRV